MLRIHLTLTHFSSVFVLKIRIMQIRCIWRRKMSKNGKIGVIKEIDSVGRIVIPKELRERYGLNGAWKL